MSIIDDVRIKQDFDPEGEKLEFRWSAAGKRIVKLDGSDGPRAGFRPAAPGRYEFRLVVAAGDRASSPARVTVEVEEAGQNERPGANMLAVVPVRPRVGAGRPVVLHAPGAKGRDVRWRQIEGPDLKPPRTIDGRAVVRPDEPGRYAFRLESPEGRARSRAVRFVVSELNARPVARARVELRRGEVILDGTGSFDPDGDPLRFRWVGLPKDEDGRHSRSPRSSAPRVRLVNVPAGRYGVKLVVTDGERVARSDVVRFVVPEDSNHR